jgi:hypothetical protein
VKPAFLAAVTSLLAVVHATSVALPQSCVALIDESLPQWKFNDVPPDAARWAKERRINPNVARGDFNADGRADYAALLSVRGVPHLAFCISHGRAVKLLTVDMPYCSDVVYQSKAGRRYYNFENGRHEVLPRDGASVSCFEKAGATYIYEKGSLRRVVDSD